MSLGYTIGDRVEVLWRGELFAATVIFIHEAEGACDAAYEIDDSVGVFLTAEEHGLKLLPDRQEEAEAGSASGSEGSPTYTGSSSTSTGSISPHHGCCYKPSEPTSPSNNGYSPRGAYAATHSTARFQPGRGSPEFAQTAARAIAQGPPLVAPSATYNYVPHVFSGFNHRIQSPVYPEALPVEMVGSSEFAFPTVLTATPAPTLTAAGLHRIPQAQWPDISVKAGLKPLIKIENDEGDICRDKYVDISIPGEGMIRRDGIYLNWVLELGTKARNALAKRARLNSQEKKVLVDSSRSYKQAISQQKHRVRQKDGQ